jgi:hypothetical protein
VAPAASAGFEGRLRVDLAPGLVASAVRDFPESNDGLKISIGTARAEWLT